MLHDFAAGVGHATGHHDWIMEPIKAQRAHILVWNKVNRLFASGAVNDIDAPGEEPLPIGVRKSSITRRLLGVDDVKKQAILCVEVF